MSTFQPPPTYADPVIVDKKTGKHTFNPVWLSWFLAQNSGSPNGPPVNLANATGILPTSHGGTGITLNLNYANTFIRNFGPVFHIFP